MIDESNEHLVQWEFSGKIWRTRRKPAPVPHCPPQIPYELTWNGSQAAAVRSRRQIAWALARPRHFPFHVTWSHWCLQLHWFHSQSISHFSAKLWYFNSRECSGCDLLGCDTVQSFMQIQTFGEEYATSIFKHHVPPKGRYSRTRLHGVTTQKTIILSRDYYF
jgi:hypothetical protein